MSEPSDAELLAKWLKQESDEAFHALTARYAGLVFMAARQTCRNETLAADAAQLTFITLARKGATLLGRDNLAGWLHRTAVFHSKNALQSQRSEARKRYEFESHFQITAPDSAGGTWEEIEPLLSEALDALPSKDRDALLLRYYRKLSLKEVAETQLISAAAAQKRVDRAIDRLRRQLALRGCMAGGGLGGALAQGLGSASSAPPSIVTSLTNQSIAAAAVPTAPTLLGLFLSILAMEKALVIVSVALLLAVVGTLAVRSKPDSSSPPPADLAADSRAGLRPVDMVSRNLSSAAAEQQRLKILYGEEQWRISTRMAADVIACVQAIRQSAGPEIAKVTPEQALGAFPLGNVIGSDVVASGQEATIQRLAHDFLMRKWEETRQSLERLDRSPAPLLELLLASDACAAGKMSLEDYEVLRNGNPDFGAVAIPVDVVNRSINADFGHPLKDPGFVKALEAHLTEEGRIRLAESVHDIASVPFSSTSTFDGLPPTRLENIAAQARGAREMIEALVTNGEIK